MICAPPAYVNLPRGSVLVQDPDEEIFLLYTRKLQLAGESTSNGLRGARTQEQEGGGGVETDGLGFAATAGEVVPVSLTVSDPWIPATASSAQGRGGEDAPLAEADGSQERNVRGRRGKTRRRARKHLQKSHKTTTRDDVTVQVELHQSLDALRHRKGDTGSVLWRLSLHLAEYFLRTHHFPPPPSRQPPPPLPLLPFLADSTVLELGSGTGFLGIALRDVVLKPSSRGRWLFSDQWANLPLVVRNLRANGVLEPLQQPSSSSASSQQNKTKAGRGPASVGQQSKRGLERVEVLELDWLAEAAEWDREQHALLSSGKGSALSPRERAASHDDDGRGGDGPVVLLAVDCIYNPSLSAPLAKTLLRQARLHGSTTTPRPGAAAAGDRPPVSIVVASELRDDEPLEAFLRAWTDAANRDPDGRWTIARLGWDDEDEDAAAVAGELASGQFVVWVAWRVAADAGCADPAVTS
ncbi:hypothetical protein JCM3774_000263 [Rhodotorula dairenensis]